MLERLFQYPKVLSRHREAPFLIERERFLQHCANQGMAHGTLTHVANELLVIISRLDITNTQQPITCQQIEIAAGRWARYQRRRGRCRKLRWSRSRFLQVATNWLREGDMPLAEMAEQLGYQSEAAFNRAFKGFTGKTPGALRREARKAASES